MTDLHGDGATAQKLSEPGLILYRAMIDQMAFLKKQQWTITNYLVLIYGAIYWLAKDVKPLHEPEKCFLTLLTVVAAIFGVGLIGIVQYDLREARSRIACTERKIFDLMERTTLGIERYQGPHARGLPFLLALIGVCVFGAILLVWSLWWH